MTSLTKTFSGKDATDLQNYEIGFVGEKKDGNLLYSASFLQHHSTDVLAFIVALDKM